MPLDNMNNHPSFTISRLGNELGDDVDLMRNWLYEFSLPMSIPQREVP
ncbi:hypothetical protein [uncultured Bacteroides sp.]|nr:hypothetical protein [uncultured Bacteroides sp.]